MKYIILLLFLVSCFGEARGSQVEVTEFRLTSDKTTTRIEQLESIPVITINETVKNVSCFVKLEFNGIEPQKVVFQSKDNEVTIHKPKYRGDDYTSMDIDMLINLTSARRIKIFVYPENDNSNISLGDFDIYINYGAVVKFPSHTQIKSIPVVVNQEYTIALRPVINAMNINGLILMDKSGKDYGNEVKFDPEYKPSEILLNRFLVKTDEIKYKLDSIELYYVDKYFDPKDPEKTYNKKKIKTGLTLSNLISLYTPTLTWKLFDSETYTEIENKRVRSKSFKQDLIIKATFGPGNGCPQPNSDHNLILSSGIIVSYDGNGKRECEYTLTIPSKTKAGTYEIKFNENNGEVGNIGISVLPMNEPVPVSKKDFVSATLVEPDKTIPLPGDKRVTIIEHTIDTKSINFKFKNDTSIGLGKQFYKINAFLVDEKNQSHELLGTQTITVNEGTSPEIFLELRMKDGMSTRARVWNRILLSVTPDLTKYREYTPTGEQLNFEKEVFIVDDYGGILGKSKGKFAINLFGISHFIKPTDDTGSYTSFFNLGLSWIIQHVNDYNEISDWGFGLSANVSNPDKAFSSTPGDRWGVSVNGLLRYEGIKDFPLTAGIGGGWIIYEGRADSKLTWNFGLYFNTSLAAIF